jgi:Ca-activated chloride channel family protein
MIRGHGSSFRLVDRARAAMAAASLRVCIRFRTPEAIGRCNLRMRDVSLGAPWALLLLLLIPFWFWRERRNRPTALPYPAVARLAAGPKPGAWVTGAVRTLRIVAIAATALAMARPRLPGRIVHNPSEGIDIVIAFDISSSMLAEDFQPLNRLEVARNKLKEFVALRPRDRIGLVAFSGEALTQVPLTADHAVLLAAVENLQPGQLEDGTAIGTAIAAAANRLRDAPGPSRVMVLLTDGVNNRGSIDPRTAAEAAAAFGIRIYTIGVGSEGMAPVPVGRGPYGLRYENRPVEIDDSLLQDVARATGGRYFRARDAEALERITREISALEKSKAQSPVYVRYRELFRWPLGAALVAILLEIGLVAWKGRIP